MNKQQIATKNYLMRAYRIDQRIANKMEQIEKLNDLATKATTTYGDMPGSPNRNIHRMEDAICKIIDIKGKINQDILELVEIKDQIMESIKSVQDPELQLLLELRYLNYVSWEKIALQMNFSIDNIFKLHKKALDEITIPEALQ